MFGSRALEWEKEQIQLEEFCVELCRRFREIGGIHEIAEFNKLQQTCSFLAY